MATEHKKVAPLLRVKGRNQRVVRKFKPLPNIPQGHREVIDDQVQDSIDLKASRIPRVEQRYRVDISQRSESSSNIARHHQANTNYAGNVGVASAIEQGTALRSNQSNNSTAFLKSLSQYDSLASKNSDATLQNEIISPNLASSGLKQSSMLKSPNNIRSIHRVRKHSKGSSPPLRSKKSSPSTKPKVYFKRGKISPKLLKSESRDSNKSHNLPTFDVKSNPKIAIFNENDEGLDSSSPPNDESIVSPSLKVQYLWKDLVKNSKIQCSQPLSPKEIERQETIFELVNTESDYLNCLFVLVEFFKKPLLELGILKSEKLMEIFANLDDILTFHTDLFKRMAAVYKKQFPIINKFAFIFVECLDQMRAYSKFVVNYKRSLSTVAELRQTNQRFGWFLEQRHQKSESRNLSLENLLLEPFQRLCRYPLLFEKILSCTNTDSSDRRDIVQVLARIRGVIQEINESKERFEIREEMHVAQFRIKGFGYFDFLTPSRELILEGGLTFLNAKEVGQSHAVKVYRQRSLPLRVFLFNDCILLAKHRNKKTGAQYKAIVPPSRVTHVQEVEDAHNTKSKSLFKITTVNRSIEKFVLEATSEQDRARWVEKINQTIPLHTRRKSDSDYGLLQNCEPHVDCPLLIKDLGSVKVNLHASGDSFSMLTKDKFLEELQEHDACFLQEYRAVLPFWIHLQTCNESLNHSHTIRLMPKKSKSNERFWIAPTSMPGRRALPDVPISTPLSGRKSLPVPPQPKISNL